PGGGVREPCPRVGGGRTAALPALWSPAGSRWPPVPPAQLTHCAAVDCDDLLLTGVAVVRGRMPYSSNGTFLVELGPADDPPAEELRDFRIAGVVDRLVIYKPVELERPLWDFPSGLHVRERATYVLSEALGW